MELGSRRTTDTEACALDSITANGRVHRPEFEFVIGLILCRRYVARDKDGNDLLGNIKDRDGTKLGHKFIHGIGITPTPFLRTVLLPEFIRLGIGFFQGNGRSRLFKDSKLRCIRLEGMIRIDNQTLGKHPFAFLTEFEVYPNIIFGNEACSIRFATKSLVDSHVGDKVQIDILRYIQENATDEIGRIKRNIEMSGESERFRVKGHKA